MLREASDGAEACSLVGDADAHERPHGEAAVHQLGGLRLHGWLEAKRVEGAAWVANLTVGERVLLAEDWVRVNRARVANVNKATDLKDSFERYRDVYSEDSDQKSTRMK